MKSVAHLDSVPQDEGFVLVGNISEFPAEGSAGKEDDNDNENELFDDEDSYDYCEDALSTSSQIHQTITSTSNPLQSVQENFFVENGPADEASLLLADSNSSLIPAEEDVDEERFAKDTGVNDQGVPTSILTVNLICDNYKPLGPPSEDQSQVVDAAPSEIETSTEQGDSQPADTLVESDDIIEDDEIVQALSRVDVAIVCPDTTPQVLEQPSLEDLENTLHTKTSGSGDSTAEENLPTSGLADESDAKEVILTVTKPKEDSAPAKSVSLVFPKTTNRKKRRKQLKLAKKAAAAAAGYAALNMRGTPPGTPVRGQKRKGKSKKVANIAVAEALKTHGEFQQQMVHLLK